MSTCGLGVVVEIVNRISKLFRVSFHVEDIFKKPYSLYSPFQVVLCFWIAILLSIFGSAGVKVAYVNVKAFRRLAPRKPFMRSWQYLLFYGTVGIQSGACGKTMAGYVMSWRTGSGMEILYRCLPTAHNHTYIHCQVLNGWADEVQVNDMDKA